MNDRRFGGYVVKGESAVISLITNRVQRLGGSTGIVSFSILPVCQRQLVVDRALEFVAHVDLMAN